MASTKTSKTRGRFGSNSKNNDSAFLLKLVLYLIVGSQWVRFTDENGLTVLPIPVGLIIGLAFAAHEHFRLDRKIEYALLLAAMLVGFWTQAGIYIQL